MNINNELYYPNSTLYSSAINNYNTLTSFNFSKSNKNYIQKLKNNFIHYTISNFSRNLEKENYKYNKKKVISLHKNLDLANNRKNFDYKKLKKNENIHKSILIKKLKQSKIYKTVEKTANENYLKEKRKKNMFITTIEEYNDNSIENLTPKKESKNDNNNLNNNIFSRKNKIHLSLNPSINAYKFDDVITPKISYDIKNKSPNKKLLSLSLFDNRNIFFNPYKISNITLPCIKFNNSLNALSVNPNQKNSLSKVCVAKLKIEIIKQTLTSYYKRFLEERDFPKDLNDAIFRFSIRYQKFFFIYDDLIKKYMMQLENEIKKNNILLNKLKTKKDKLINENEAILKQILALQEKVKIYESFNNLCLNLKYKANQNQISSNTNKSASESTSKSKQISKEISKSKSPLKSPGRRKRNSTFKSKKDPKKSILGLKKSSEVENNSIYIPQKVKEVLKNTEEIQIIFEDRDYKVFHEYERYNKSIYNKIELVLEYNKEKKNENYEMENNEDLINHLENIVFKLKRKNQYLIEYKTNLIKIQKNQNEKNDLIYAYSKDNNNKNDDIIMPKIYKKIKDILLNPKINLEKILEQKKLYQIIKEKDFILNIAYKGEIYSEELFNLKILESLYLKMIQWKEKCLSNENTRKKYMKIKSEREKELKYLKCEQNLLEEKMNFFKKKLELINKNNKIIFIRNRKYDPFYKKFIKDSITKKRLKFQKNIDKNQYESENDKYNNYLYY